MKYSSITAKIQAIAAILFSLALCGCTTTDSDKDDPLKQTQLHVSQAMQTFRNANISGNITVAQRKSIESAHKEYEAAYGTAQSNPDTASVDAAKKAAEHLITLVDGLL